MLSRLIFFPWQRKINCEEGREFVFILAWWSWVPGWRRTAVGEGWPTRCLLPLPCLAAQSLWQNKPPGILGKHWEPLTGMRTISWARHSQKLHTPNTASTPFPQLNCCLCIPSLSKTWNSHDQQNACFSQWLANYEHDIARQGAEVANKHVLLTRFNNAEQEIRSSML